MRIGINHPRLRIIALVCWTFGLFCLFQSGVFSMVAPALLALTISTKLLAIILLSLGLAFWLLSGDKRAGVVFDSKGLLLNLGSSSSFIAWENIERIGVSSHRSQLLAVGSHRQLGVLLRDTSRYVQSYEERMPSNRGVFVGAMRQLQQLLRGFRRGGDRPLIAQLAHNRAVTGFDVLIPEAFLGGRADTFVGLVDAYRTSVAPQRQAATA